MIYKSSFSSILFKFFYSFLFISCLKKQEKFVNRIHVLDDMLKIQERNLLCLFHLRLLFDYQTCSIYNEFNKRHIHIDSMPSIKTHSMIRYESTINVSLNQRETRWRAFCHSVLEWDREKASELFYEQRVMFNIRETTRDNEAPDRVERRHRDWWKEMRLYLE